MTAPDYQPKVANPFTEDSPAGEVLDADTITLITQLGASLSQRAVQLAEENQQLKAEVAALRGGWKPLSRRENERLRELVGQAWSALGEAGIGQGPDLTLADAIRTLADTPLDALPAPDVTNPEHNAFIYAWFGQLSDEQLGDRDGVGDGFDRFEVIAGRNLGDVVREQVLMLIDRLDAQAADAARRSHDIDIVADLCGDRFLAAQIVDALDVNEGTR